VCSILQNCTGKAADPARFLRLSRGMTLAWGLVLMGFGLVKWGPLLETGLTVASLPFGKPARPLSSRHVSTRGANARGALAGMIVGLAAILCLFQFTSVAYTWYFMIGALITFLLSAGLRAELRSRRGAARCAPCFARTVRFRRTLFGGDMTEKNVWNWCAVLGGVGRPAAIVVGTMIGTGIFLKPAENGARGTQRLRRIRGVDRGARFFRFLALFFFVRGNWDR